MALVKFKQGTFAEIQAAAFTEGVLYFASDSGSIAYDLNGQRKWIYAPRCDTKANFDANNQYVPAAGEILVYTDGLIEYDDGNNPTYYPGIKIGNGKDYAINMPFITDYYASASALASHINDTVVHITEAERIAWNAKMRCYIGDDGDTVIFTTN